MDDYKAVSWNEEDQGGDDDDDGHNKTSLMYRIFLFIKSNFKLFRQQRKMAGIISRGEFQFGNDRKLYMVPFLVVGCRFFFVVVVVENFPIFWK